MTDAVKIHFPKKKQTTDHQDTSDSQTTATTQESNSEHPQEMPKEFGGRPKEKGLEPTRYGDWEFKGRCIDF